MGIKKDICILPCDAGNIKKKSRPIDHSNSGPVFKKSKSKMAHKKSPYCSKMGQIF